MLKEIKHLNTQIQHLNHQIWQTSIRSKDIEEDLTAKLQALGITPEYYGAFLPLLEGNKKVLSYFRDEQLIKVLLNHKAKIYHFEPDPLLYQHLKIKYQYSLILYNNSLGDEEVIETILRDTEGNGNHPSIYYKGNHCFSVQKLKMSKVIKDIGYIDYFICNLDFETYFILQDLIQSKVIENIGFILCKVDAMFKEIEVFKNLHWLC